MTRFAAVLAAAAIISVTAHAATAATPVRSGEHPGFSRLVIEFEDRPAWRTERSDRTVSIRFDRDVRLDTSRVFSLIPRTRLRALNQQEDALELSFAEGCGCGLRIFPVRQGALVLDILDAPPGPAPVVHDRSLQSVSWAGGTGVMSLEAPRHVMATEGSGVPRVQPPPLQLPAGGADLPAVSPVVPGAPSALTSSLAEALSRAAGRGLLQMTGRIADEPSVSGPAEVGVVITLPGERSPAAARASVPEGCGPDGALGFVDVPEDKRFPRIADLASAVARETGGFDGNKAVDLSRAYIAAGFGAEARAVIDRFAPEAPEAGVLTFAAAVVDAVGLGDYPDPGALAQCPADRLVWVAVADPRALSGAAGDTVRDIHAVFLSLPATLQHRLGPRLETAFAQAGHGDAAAEIRALLDALSPAAARTHGAEGGDADLDGALARRDVEALTINLEALARRGAAPDAGTLERIADLAADMGISSESVALQAALVRAHAAADRPRNALTRLVAIMRRDVLPDEIPSGLADAIIAAALATESDAQFLAVSHEADAAGIADTIAADLRTGVARRLHGLGADDLALAFARDEPVASDLDAVAAARQLMSERRYAEALGRLETVSTLDVSGLRRRAELGATPGAVRDERARPDNASAARITAIRTGRADTSDLTPRADGLAAPRTLTDLRTVADQSASLRKWVSDRLANAPAP